MPAEDKQHAKKRKSAQAGGKASRKKRQEKFGTKFEVPIVPSVQRKPYIAKRYGWA